MFAFGESITVTTRVKTGVDDYGNDVFTEASITRPGVYNPAIGFESTNGKDQVTVQPQAAFTGQPATDVNAVIASTSALTIRGLQYEVDGDAEWVRSPFTGWEAGLIVPLKRVTG